MEKSDKRILRLSVAFLSALILAALCGLPAAAQQAATQPKVIGNAVVNAPIHSDVSQPLGEMLAQAPAQGGVRLMHAPMKPKVQQLTDAQKSQVAGAASAVQPLTASPISATIGLSFEGVGNTSFLNCPAVALQEVAPPDTNAAVGDTQVVEWVNTCYAVFNKSTGALTMGPFSGTNFWKGFGAPCETNNDGDIIIQWDKTNHRWLAAQNVFAGPPFFTCVAVSQTDDALGSYNRYVFPQSGFPDYPKWGLKPNVYYQTQNDFGPEAQSFIGVIVCAYQANLMRKGNPNASQVCIVDNSDGTLFDDSMLPADDDTANGPNGPEVLLGAIDNFLPGDTHVYEFVFTVDFDEPANSTLAGVDGSMPISVPAFNLAFCAPSGFLTTDCVPQPHTKALLDTLGDRLMYRLAHFIDGSGTQHFLVNHSTNEATTFTGPVAATWYEFRAPEKGSTNLSLYQSGQTPNDGEYRWMGSVAMDKMGDIAIGYSRSSGGGAKGDFPSIYFAGQKAGEPLGTTDTEALIKQGTGFQPDTDNRWGDYSSMALDGGDSCTFWYANEYYDTDLSFNWATWVASLKFPTCH